jgi:hypothetical protein
MRINNLIIESTSIEKISPRPSFPKRGKSSLWQREVRRDYSIM